ncbi:MAG: ABC transporter permease [Bradymonadaceae bacterium]
MWRLAWRNLWRNGVRTAILLTAIAFSQGMMLLWIGISGDMYSRMREGAVETAGGAVLVHGEGFWQAKSSDIVIENPGAVRRAIDATPRATGTVSRVLINGLLSSPRGNAPGRIRGVKPEEQRALRDMSTYLVRGDYLSGEHERPIVLGIGLVETLEVDLGDKVVVTTSDEDGEMTRALFRLRGVLKTGSEQMDDALAFTTLEAAQRAINLGNRVHQIGVLAPNDVDTAALARDLRDRLGSKSRALEVLTWQQAMPELVGFIQIDSAMLYVYLAVIFVIVAFVIANTFLMSVMERVREFGLFSALGLNDRRVGKLVLAETLLLASVAMALGFGLGLVGHLLVDHYGIDIATFGADQIEISGVAFTDRIIRSKIVWFDWLAASVGVLVTILLSAAYPAWKATRLAPSKAMEFYEN